MPSRISLPKLSLFSSRDSSSPSQTGSKMPAPTVPPTNITQRASTASPPARLHLRNILPASPEEPPIMPPPPRMPKAWVWQCHQCHSVYRLGCTRRCLDCSHTYCVVSSKQQQQQQQSSSNKSRKRRRQQQTALCGAEFDYVGWEQWGSWKRKVLGYESTGRCDATARDRAFLAKSHNCWIDCDSPSECGHRRYELAAEMLRHRMFVPPPPPPPHVVADASPKSPDDDIPLTEALVMSEATAAGAGDEEGPLKSPLKSSFLLDDDGDGDEMEKTREQEEEEEERWWAARSSSEQVDDDDDDDDGGGGVKTLTVRNLTADDIAEDSDSEADSGSESGESGWSTASSVTDDTCCLGEAGTAIKGF